LNGIDKKSVQMHGVDANPNAIGVNQLPIVD